MPSFGSNGCALPSRILDRSTERVPGERTSLLPFMWSVARWVSRAVLRFVRSRLTGLSAS